MDKLDVVGWLRDDVARAEARIAEWEGLRAARLDTPAQAEIDRLRGEVSRLQRLLDDTTGSLNTAEAQVFTLRGEVEKAIRILSDRKKHELTRIVDARDVLILSKPATLKDTPHD